MAALKPRQAVPQWALSPADAMKEPSDILSVSDIERLVKAGVTASFAEIAEYVVPDAKPHLRPQTLEESFWERWKRANTPDPYTFDGMRLPYAIAAHQHGDKVTVFVAPNDKAPFMLEDESCLYPSDALMAKLALWEKTK